MREVIEQLKLPRVAWVTNWGSGGRWFKSSHPDYFSQCFTEAAPNMPQNEDWASP